MSATLPPASGRDRRLVEFGPLLVLAGVGASLALGMMLGYPTTEQRLMGLLILGILSSTLALVWPSVMVQIVFASSLMLVAWVVTGQRAINPIDLLMPPVLVAGLIGSARRRARREDAAGSPLANPAIRMATQRLVRCVWAFYGVAALSLVALGMRGNVGGALDSGLLLFRAIQGVLFFAMGIWWMRDERGIQVTERALQVGGWALVLANTWFILTMHISRAGVAWVVNDPAWPMSSPNEAAISLLILWAILNARPETRRSPMRILLMGACLIMLILTQSRSGLLAWLVYNLLTVRWWRMRSLAAVVAVLVPLAIFAPEKYMSRLSRTLALDGGSFEAFTSIIRFYDWNTALRVFLAHPLIGVGYMGYRFVSDDYNDFRLQFGTAESYYLEVAADMGIAGVITLGLALFALWRVGKVVRSVTPPGSHGHELARRHGPLLLALMVSNLTGNNFVGLVGLAQIALWTALLVRAGHLSATGARVSAPLPGASPAI
ncbi:MAG: O-antigen ligase family protein [Candidatus Eisenbacteria bacterium]